MEQVKHIISSTPHIRAPITTDKIMKLVLIALAPAGVMGVWFFGLRALLVMTLSVASCVVFEWLYQKLTKQPVTVYDCSAAVTGLLLAYNLPASSPVWLPIIGAFIAIVVVKQLFGGLGQNFLNPALAGRAFLTASFMPQMTGDAFKEPVRTIFDIDISASATPLANIAEADMLTLFIGAHGGVIGETSAAALLIGGLFLIYKKVITWHIPVAFIGTVFVGIFILQPDGFSLTNPVMHLLAGGLMLGAFFMATDYSSSPVAPAGKLIMGVGCGVFVTVMRMYSDYPEGVMYSILLMNLTVPLIDKYVKPRVFGKVKAKKEGQA
jgi:electron transport complex protein RnfD